MREAGISSTPEKAFDSVEDNDAKASIKKKTKGNSKKELTLSAQNESASKKKRPFEYNEKDDNKGKAEPFSLKDLDPE